MFMGSWTRGDMGSQPPPGSSSQDEPVAFPSPGKATRVYPAASQDRGSQQEDPLCSFVPCTALPVGGRDGPEAAEAAGPSQTTSRSQEGKPREPSQAVESAPPPAPVGSSQSPPKAPAARAGGAAAAAAAAAALASRLAHRDAEQEHLDHLEAVRRQMPLNPNP